MNKYILNYKLFETDEFRNPEYRNFKQNQEFHHKLLSMDKKTFDDIYSKHKWYSVNKTKSDIKNNLFSLVNMAYDNIGGHVRINSPEKVIQDNDLNFWTAIDINNDPYADIVIFGKKTKYGIKISGLGHNSTSESNQKLMEHLISLLNRKGYFMEACDRPAEKLLDRNAPVVHDINIIREMFDQFGSDAKYIDDDNIWYIRTVNLKGEKSKEVLFGNPTL